MDIDNMCSRVEHTLIKYIHKLCAVCMMQINDDVCAASCCSNVYHTACLKKTKVCPICRLMFNINITNPLLTTLMHDMRGFNDVMTLYTEIYRDNPIDLKLIDRAIRTYRPSQYCTIFRGYYPYCAFNTGVDMERFYYNWNVFCYGLLHGYDWCNTSACGRAVWCLAKQGVVSDDDHIYLVIHSLDYRAVRRQLAHLFSTVEINCLEVGIVKSDILMHIQEGIIVITIRGFVRKICIYVEYNNDPFWIIYKPPTHFNTYGSLFSGTSVNMTINAIVNNKSPDYPILPSLDYVLKYGESDKAYSNRMGYGVGTGDLLLKDIYPEYKLRINTKDRHTAATLVINNISDILDTVVCAGSAGGVGVGVGVELVSGSRSVTISSTMFDIRNIRRQVSKVIYRRPMHIRIA